MMHHSTLGSIRASLQRFRVDGNVGIPFLYLLNSSRASTASLYKQIVAQREIIAESSLGWPWRLV
jgi:hypothetical protein